MKGIVFTLRDGQVEIPIPADRDVLAKRYAILAVAFLQVLEEMADPEANHLEGLERSLDGERGLSWCLSYVHALLEQFGSDAGVDTAVSLRHALDLEAFLGIVADRPGARIEATPERFVLDSGGVRMEIGRRAFVRTRQKVERREDVAEWATKGEPEPVG